MLADKHKSSYHSGMNKLSVERRVKILSMLCEGSSMRSVSRVCDVSINTVSKLLEDAGMTCALFHSAKVQGLKTKRLQVDEIWAFCYSKARNLPKAKAAPYGAGDVWTWTALDADSKLIVSWLVGGRDAGAALDFITDVKTRIPEREKDRLQITSDGLRSYAYAIEETLFDVDYATLVKIYGEAPDTERRYSPPICIGTKKHRVMGNPDPAHISTSYVERSNLQMRMGMRRFTRLTNAHSKKFDNHNFALAIYFMFYNWIRIHSALRVTPAMAAGLTDKLMDWEDVVALMDAREGAPKKRGQYKKRVA